MAAERIALPGPGDHGPPDGREPGARRASRCVAWNRTRERAEELAAEHDGRDAWPTAPPRPPRGGHRDHDGARRARGRGGAARRRTAPPTGCREGGLAIDMSTIAPTASRSIGERLERARHRLPGRARHGSRPKAEDGTLTIMAGGRKAAFDRARPAFEAMGELVLHVGPQGHGSMVKLINNTHGRGQRRRAGRGHRAGAARPGWTWTRRCRWRRSGSGDSAMLRAQVRADGRAATTSRCSSSSTCSRTCATDRRGARRWAWSTPWRAPPRRRYAEADARGLGEQDFAAVIEAARP